MSTLHRTYRFATVPEWLLWHPDLSSLAVRVYATLDRFGQTPDRCFPSHAEIAKRIGVSARSVARPLDELEAVGALRVVHRGKPGGGRTSDGYWLAGDAPLPGQTTLRSAESLGAKRAQERGTKRAESANPGGGKARSGARLTRVTTNESQSNEKKQLPRAADAAQETGDSDPFFDRFWKTYPRRTARKAAYRAWQSALKSTTATQIIAGAERYAQERAGEDPTYTKHPTTWLNGGCWGDEPAPRRGPRVANRDNATLDRDAPTGVVVMP